MIVLLSYPGDRIAHDVMDWLNRYDCTYKRINLEEEDYRKIEVNMKASSQIRMELKDGTILDLDKVSIFFFRGGLLKSDVHQYHLENVPDKTIKTHLTYEFNTLTQFFYHEIAKKCLGNPLLHPLNKLLQLQLANEVGLMIPETIIRKSKSGLAHFTEEGMYITKAIQENILLPDTPSIHYDLKVNTIKKSELPEHFFPSLFQPVLSKNAELRIFYLDGSFYPLAMLLHPLEVRATDYRSVISKIRYAKYKLPRELENKLGSFMKRIGLNMGSIDLIVDTSGAYYFLEVNPTGQIGWVSDFGNYFLEEKIARYLVTKEMNFLNYESVPTTC